MTCDREKMSRMGLLMVVLMFLIHVGGCQEAPPLINKGVGVPLEHKNMIIDKS